jgi:hypothetical protein
MLAGALRTVRYTPSKSATAITITLIGRRSANLTSHMI